jgi:putative ABC transport system permease protein
VQSVLLRPLPFPEQDSLRVIWKADPKSGAPFLELAYPELLDLQSGVGAFESVAVMPTTLYGYDKVIDVAGQNPLRVESTPVSSDFFRTLGVTPVLGRDFSPRDVHAGAASAVILSDHLWRQHFSADEAIVGEQIRLNGVGHTVIGVMGPEVEFHRGASLWVPLRIRLNRRMSYVQAIVRVRPGYTDEQVAAEVNDLL